MPRFEMVHRGVSIMRLRAFATLVLFFAATTSSATDLERTVPGGRFVACEFVGLGSDGSVRGSITVSKTATDPTWASTASLILIEDAKPSHTFRLSLASVSTSKKLEARYELFVGEHRLIAEGLSEVTLGTPLAYQLAWTKDGHIQLAVGNTTPRYLRLDIRPSRALALISGAHGRIHTEGNETIDCSRDIAEPANEREARLLERANAGDVEAMYQLFLDIGKKGSPDHPLSKEEIRLAKYWLDKAGEGNSWRAAFVLQLCYEKGCWDYPIDLEKSKYYQAIFEKYRPNDSFNRETQQQALPAVGAR